ncbi:HNH endonuclease [Undibacterium sp. Ji50W]|uniref:HNH endonuclease n=1 Tax=Undibacterium sp. Ji50W TaxID=3413041 RepID=UPI003BEFB084
MKMATRNLRDMIGEGIVLPDKFAAAQLKAIQRGSERIPDYTWHHHQDTRRMQLVPEKIHGTARHVGWESMSKGPYVL